MLTDRTLYWAVNLGPYSESIVGPTVPYVAPTPFPPGGAPTYSMAQVQAASTSGSCQTTTCNPANCYIVLFGNVYNATVWSRWHPLDTPGGALPCGTDATSIYSAVAQHTFSQAGMRLSYLGPLAGATQGTYTPPTPAYPASGSVTSSMVAQHNTALNCWTIISGNVYDLTYWANYGAANGGHPGGNLIFDACGVDGTYLFGLVPGHDAPALSQNTVFLGALYTPTTGPTAAATTTGVQPSTTAAVVGTTQPKATTQPKVTSVVGAAMTSNVNLALTTFVFMAMIALLF